MIETPCVVAAVALNHLAYVGMRLGWFAPASTQWLSEGLGEVGRFERFTLVASAQLGLIGALGVALG